MAWIEAFPSVDWSQVSVIALGAYILGCFATGYYLVRLRTGQDIRELGSGSAGAKNVGRVLGWRGFVTTLFGDFGKGLLAVWMVRQFAQDAHAEALAAVALLAVAAGHIWPAQLRCRGGKGVATSLGGLLVFDPGLAVAFALVFAVGFAALRRTVLPGLLAFAALPFASVYLRHDTTQVMWLSILAGMIWISHHKNLLEEASRWLERRNERLKHHPPDL